GMIFVALSIILTYMGTPKYGVDTAGDQETEQDMIPDEGIGPVRAIPYDQLILTSEAPIYGDLKNTEATGIEMAELDTVLVELNAIVIEEDNLSDLAERYEENYPVLFEVIEEFHHLVFDKYAEDMPDATGYFVITQVQPNLRRFQIQITWNVEEDGETVRNTSGKVAYIHAESEWHEH
ncbi:MAG TPA: hypothetical protein VJZ27_13685, partial [Aggregatilineales bacterium]|nr:hypothetical protein [Aggregatilineales bacterium]